MSLHHSARGRLGLAIGAFGASALLLAGCAGGGGGESTDGGDASGEPLIVGTTDKVTTLDPAGSYDNGSLAVQVQVFATLLDSPQGSSEVEPDIAVSAEYTAPTDYTVTLKPDLKFANGNDLTSSDVKFSFERQLAIADPSGPSYLLYNLDSIDTPDDETVVFHLKSENDVIFPKILSSPVAPIVDEEVFAADAVTPDEDIVAANAFNGAYVITDYQFNELVTFSPNEAYDGMYGTPKTDDVTLKYYTEASNLKLDVQEGNIDVAYRSLNPTDIESLRGDDAVDVIDGPGGQIRYMTFNFDTMPFGTKTADADPAKALAVRQAIADVIDRQEISDQVYKGAFVPLYSYVPDDVNGAYPVLESLYGDGSGGADVDKATAALEAAGVTTPLAINIQYNPDHYGESSADEWALIKSQLEESGLFTVSLNSTEWNTYKTDYSSDGYPIWQMGWFPDYADGENYLSVFFNTDNFFNNHFSDPEVDALIAAQATEQDPQARDAILTQIQDIVGSQLPTIPLLQGHEVAVTGTDVSGVVLDASNKFRYVSVVKD
jgi:peptide/nickel transport system substrate-binding protein